MCGIYKITNKINNKCYIGQSIHIEDRWQRHKEDSKNVKSKTYNYPLYRAFRKYGIENFTFEVLEECSKSSLDIREKFWINFYNSLEFGYNQVMPNQAGTVLTPQKVKEIILELQNNKKDSTEDIGKKFGVSGRTIRSINKGESWRFDELSYPIRPVGVSSYTKTSYNTNYLCKTCHKNKVLKPNTNCVDCSHKAQRKADRPTREELKKLIRTMPFTVIGSQFGVSDNAIRKWCDAYNLPRKATEIKKYSDKEWEKI